MQLAFLIFIGVDSTVGRVVINTASFSCMETPLSAITGRRIPSVSPRQESVINTQYAMIIEGCSSPVLATDVCSYAENSPRGQDKRVALQEGSLTLVEFSLG